MPWYYNSDSGSLQETSEWQAWLQLHSGLGWHGPFTTEADAVNFYLFGKDKNPGWKAPTTDLGKTAEQYLQTTTSNIPIVKDVTGGLVGLSNTIVKLATRVLEGAAGIVLLAIAANAILKQTTGVNVAGGAKRVARTAARVP